MIAASNRLVFLLALFFTGICSSVNAFRQLPSVKGSSRHVSLGSKILTRQESHHLPFLRKRSSSLKNLPISKDVSEIDNSVELTEVVPPIKKSSLVPRLASVTACTLMTLFCFQSPSLASVSSVLENLKAEATNSGFIQAFLLIFISEIGDKTFFIAGLLAAKYGRFISFTGSIGALGVMTVISTVLGQLFHAVPSSLTQGVPYDDYIAVAAFAYFGLKTLFEASKLSSSDNSGMDEEKAEAEELVEEVATAEQKRKSAIALILQTFSLVFAAEIGDRSFLSTIALSAALNPYAVAAGAIAAHASATGVAVIGGSILSKYLSEKVIGYIGGTLFLVFAVTTALGLF